MTLSFRRRRTPPENAPTSNVVPPMSATITSWSSTAALALAAPAIPPTGPDWSVPIGSSRAASAGSRPPSHWASSSGPR